jgi:RNA polymerase sigma-70 factor (ECF subfamily)
MRMAGTDSQPGSFEELAMPLFDRLYNFACWLTQDRTEAEDLLQETYVKALKGFSTFRQGTNFRAWMYRILRNTFLTSRTGLRVALEIPADSEDEESNFAVETQTPESILASRSDSEMVQRCIETLPVHHREVILLCEVEEMSYQDIADALAIPIGTVMSRLSRARKMLRQELALQLKRG